MASPVSQGNYCPWPLASDGHPHAVVDGVCMTCGAQIVPARRPEIGPGMYYEQHYLCLSRKPLPLVAA